MAKEHGRSDQLTRARTSSDRAKHASGAIGRGNPPRALGSAAAVVYVHLFVIEGAVRKWVPGTEQPLYFFRDLLIGATILLLLMVGRSPRSALIAIYVFFILSFWSIQSIALSLPLPISIVGARSYIAPVLFVALLLQLRDRGLVIRTARTLLYYAPVQLAVSLLQVTAAPEAWVNKSVGSDVGAAFINDGVARASGTFSAPAALFLYLTLALAMGLAMLGAPERRDRTVAVAAVVSLIGCAAISGSRATILLAGILLVLFMVAPGRQAVRARIGIGVAAATVVAAAIWLFPTVYRSTTARIANAADTEDTWGRVLNQAFGFAQYPFEPLGDGMGTRSQAGIALGSPLDWVEIESMKWPAELGFVGFVIAFVVLFAAGVCILHAFRCRHYGIDGQIHRYALLALGLILTNGQITQFPSAQAFTAIALGLAVLPVSRVVSDGSCK